MSRHRWIFRCRGLYGFGAQERRQCSPASSSCAIQPCAQCKSALHPREGGSIEVVDARDWKRYHMKSHENPNKNPIREIPYTHISCGFHQFTPFDVETRTDMKH